MPGALDPLDEAEATALRVHLVQVGRRAWRGPARTAAPVHGPQAPLAPAVLPAAALPALPPAAGLLGGSQKPGSEVVVVLQRVEMTLTASGGLVFYSPTEGVMTGVRPRYVFDGLEFREKVGAPGPALEGLAVRCAVVATGAAAAAGGAPAAEGLAPDDTLCGVAGVDRPASAPDPAGVPRPADKPTLAPAADKPTLAPGPVESHFNLQAVRSPSAVTVVTMRRVNATLSSVVTHSMSLVVYSPGRSADTSGNSRFLFDQRDFRHKVGDLGPELEGVAVHCEVVANGSQQAQDTDTLCKIVGVERPEEALPWGQHERSARRAAEVLLGVATLGLAGPSDGGATTSRLHLGGAASLIRRLSALWVPGSAGEGSSSLPLLVGALSFLALATCAWAACLAQGFRAAEVEGVLPLPEGEDLPHADAVRAFRQSLRGRDRDRRQRSAACC